MMICSLFTRTFQDRQPQYEDNRVRIRSANIVMFLHSAR